MLEIHAKKLGTAACAEQRGANARPLLAEATLALGLPLIHARSAVVATVERGPSPLYDAIWMHKASD